MDISVIVLTYNQEDTIKRTLDSVLSQDFNGNFEIIIGDDASTDNTEKICRNYELNYPDRIKYIRQEQNIGLVKNYFDCFSRTKGEYIADCSGDDYWTDEKKLQRQYDFLESNSEVSLVSGEWICEDESTLATYKAPNSAGPGEYSGREFILELLTNTKVINLSSSLYRKKIVTEMLEKNPDIIKGKDSRFEDLQIILSCARKGKIAVLPGVVLHYSVGHESVSHPGSFTKRFLYSSQALRQSIKLQEYFLDGTSTHEKRILEKNNKKKGDYIIAMAFKSGIHILKETSKKELKSVPSGLKGKVYKFLMRNNYLWINSHKLLKVLSLIK